MKKVIIMRGIAGSGKDSYIQNRFFKSTVARSGEKKVKVCSADDYFVKHGKYVFDPSKLAEAHSTCYRAFLDAVASEYNIIVINNTNIHRWEYANYDYAAGLFGYEVEIVEMQVETLGQARLCAYRNTHGVPAEIVAKMAMEFEPDGRATKIQIFSDSGKAGAIYPCQDEG